MKTIQQTGATQKLTGEVRLAWLQLAKAESQLAEAKAQSRQARKRRKAAKQAARRAKKRAKQAKENVAGAKRALAKLEAELARTNPTKVKRRPRRTAAKKDAAIPRRKRPARVAAIRPREILKIKKPATVRKRSQQQVGPAGEEAKRPAINQDSEPPVILVPPPAPKASAQMVKGVKKIFTREIKAVAPVETRVPGSLAPENKTAATPNEPSPHSTINQQETS